VASGVSITRRISQLHSGRQHLELSTPPTEQHRDLVDLQLIEHARLKRRLCRIRAMYQHVAVTRGGLRLAIALTIPSVTYVTNGYFATDRPGGR
jgi:hypothetical protein